MVRPRLGGGAPGRRGEAEKGRQARQNGRGSSPRDAIGKASRPRRRRSRKVKPAPMDAEGLKELFAPFAPVSVKRMFSGHGVYADGVCFALNLRGDIFLKADSLTEQRFAE